MINNKDPLIAAVQKVMQDSYAERNAVKVVNEKFGIVDRRVLPRENQGEWDAAYQMVLSEGVEALDEKVHPSKYSSKQKELAAVGKNVDPDDNPKTIGRADLKAASMGHASHIGKAKKMKGDNPLSEEGDPSKAIPGDTVTGGSSVTPVPKPRPTSITPEQQNALTNKIKSIKEAKKASMCESNNKGFNNRRDLSVTASAGKQVVADQLNEAAKKIVPGADEDGTEGHRNSTGGGGGFNPAAIPSGIGSPDRNRGMEAGGTGKKFSIGNAPGLSGSSVAKFRKTLNAKMDAGGSRGKSGNALKKPVAKAKAGKAAQPAAQPAPQPGTQPGFDASGNRVYNNAFTKIINDANARKARVKAVSRTDKNTKPVDNSIGNLLQKQSAQAAKDARVARVKAVARPAKKVDSAAAASSKLRSPSGTFAANLQKARDKAQGSRVAVNTSAAPAAAPKPVVNTRGFKIVAPVVTAAGAATAAYMYGKQDNAAAPAAASAAQHKSKRDGELGAGWEDKVPLEAPPPVADPNTTKTKSVVQVQPPVADPNTTKTRSVVQAQPPVAAPAVAMTARKIEATPRKVSDTEIMNAPKYKQAVKAVGGEAGARKIQPGTDVAGVGKVDKGETIWSKVKTQLEKQPVKGFEAGAKNPFTGNSGAGR